MWVQPLLFEVQTCGYAAWGGGEGGHWPPPEWSSVFALFICSQAEDRLLPLPPLTSYPPPTPPQSSLYISPCDPLGFPSLADHETHQNSAVHTHTDAPALQFTGL